MATIVGEDAAAKKRATCSSCAGIIEYALTETEKRSHRDYAGELDTWSVIVCPRCGGETKVNGY